MKLISLGALRPHAALSILGVTACLTASLVAPAHAEETTTTSSSVSKSSSVTDQKLLTGEYIPDDVEKPVDGREGGAEMGQAMKYAKAETETSLGHFSKTQSVASVPTNGVPGMDVSVYQSNVDWAANYAKGARFAYVKATEGDYYKSAAFSKQYAGATQANIIRGGYHFAIPAESDGATQARYFVANGGGWSADGRTLPGMLDIEYNPYQGKYYGNTCYDMSSSQLVKWISDFTQTYKSLTGRYPVIYTASNWWSYCIGNNVTQFNRMPIHHASYNGTPGTMPSGWMTYDIWQFTDAGPFDGDSNVLNGTMNDLRALASSAGYVPKGGLSPIRTQFFTDVSIYHYFYNEISWLASTGITTGWSDGTYRPGNNINRDAMAAFLYRMAGSPAYTAPKVARFKDVPTSHPFYKEISWLADQGITTGWVDGTFHPDANITREAVAAFMHRMAGSPAAGSAASFTDVTNANPFKNSIQWMASQNITTGYSDGTYRPGEPVTREAMAAFVYRFTYRG